MGCFTTSAQLTGRAQYRKNNTHAASMNTPTTPSHTTLGTSPSCSWLSAASRYSTAKRKKMEQPSYRHTCMRVCSLWGIWYARGVLEGSSTDDSSLELYELDSDSELRFELKALSVRREFRSDYFLDLQMVSPSATQKQAIPNMKVTLMLLRELQVWQILAILLHPCSPMSPASMVVPTRLKLAPRLYLPNKPRLATANSTSFCPRMQKYANWQTSRFSTAMAVLLTTTAATRNSRPRARMPRQMQDRYETEEQESGGKKTMGTLLSGSCSWMVDEGVAQKQVLAFWDCSWPLPMNTSCLFCRVEIEDVYSKSSCKYPEKGVDELMVNCADEIQMTWPPASIRRPPPSSSTATRLSKYFFRFSMLQLGANTTNITLILLPLTILMMDEMDRSRGRLQQHLEVPFILAKVVHQWSCSISQAAEHPSPDATLKSSHCSSGGYRMPLPQIRAAGVHSLCTGCCQMNPVLHTHEVVTKRRVDGHDKQELGALV